VLENGSIQNNQFQALTISEITGFFDESFPKKKALIAFQTCEGDYILYKKGRYGYYLERQTHDQLSNR
jgi:topoisomerase IA-like protein